ncbi:MULTISPECIES: sensor histidine kinase [unclassified Xanthobacter]|uniref:sensor histidine kinase n=1 Tax=unclassified Xanthobacter TaxID=2623496 RepID=UPI001F2CBD0A|nr:MULTISPECIES: sensor histidine kinase [unclassified Xanthobacter]
MEWVKAQAVRARHKERGAIFEAAAGHPRSLLDSVRRRLIVMVLFALAPIAGLNFVQGALQLQAAQQEARQRLLQHVLTDASTLEKVFASAENVLRALQNVADVREAGPSCQAILHGAVLSLPFASNIGVMNRNGAVECSALPLEARDVSGQGWWRQATRETRFLLSERVFSRAAQTEVLVGVLPLRERDGTFSGAIGLSIDVSWLEARLRRETPASQGVVALFSAEGKELLSNARQVSAVLFAGKEMTADAGGLRDVGTADGRDYTFATAPLGRDGLVAAFAMPTSRLFRWTLLTVAASFALPTVIVVASIIGLWLAVDRIVLQWLLYLRRVTAVYAQGHYAFRPTRIDAAPSEFRALGHAVENMALAVRERDGQLRQALAEKTALVREIHHRIKNSLQIVVSLISLYGAGMRGDDRRRFDQLRTRVNTLALVHRILYEAADGSQVRLRELLGELAALLEGACERPARITVEAQDAALPTDMAVPLALMVVEIVLGLTGGSESTLRADKPAALTLTGGLADGMLSIRVSANVPEAATTGDLAHGFAAQLGGSLVHVADGARMVVTGAFPCR